MRLSAVSVNLGCGGPHPTVRQDWAVRWLSERVREQVDVLFLQEAPSAAAETLAQAYEFFTPSPEAGAFRCRSAVAIRTAAELEVSPFTVPTARYHGSYVAATCVVLPGVGPVALLSVHASPTKPSAQQQKNWSGPTPAARRTGHGELWDSDFVLATIARVSTTIPVLAAGDFNEALDWDRDHDGNWGAEYFELARRAELSWPTRRLWSGERATRGGLQLDHLLATPGVDAFVCDARVGDDSELGEGDHLPIWFTLAVPSG